MPATLVIPVAGRYAGAYTPPGGSPLLPGILNDNGFDLSVSVKGQEVNETDAYGLSLVEGIYRGADWRITYQCKEYKADNVQIMWPWGKGAGILSPIMGPIGRRWGDVAGSLVLTATPGTPAANNPATLTAALCIISPNTNLSMLFTSKVREVPINQIMLPYDLVGNGTIGWFSTT